MKMPPGRGNALFLILIAVALFAALSYALTSSSRGGGGIDREQASLRGAELVQYGSFLRATVDRMVLTGTSVADLELCPPADGDQSCSPDGTIGPTCTTGSNCAFAPEGGGIHAMTRPKWQADAIGGFVGWTMTHENATANHAAVQGIGESDTCVTAGSRVGCDIYMSMTVTQEVCEAINTGLGLSVPVAADNDHNLNQLLSAYPGEPFFCFVYAPSVYVYIHTLVER